MLIFLFFFLYYMKFHLCFTSRIYSLNSLLNWTFIYLIMSINITECTLWRHNVHLIFIFCYFQFKQISFFNSLEFWRHWLHEKTKTFSSVVFFHIQKKKSIFYFSFFNFEGKKDEHTFTRVNNNHNHIFIK